jgi:hypothetical protein
MFPGVAVGKNIATIMNIEKTKFGSLQPPDPSLSGASLFPPSSLMGFYILLLMKKGYAIYHL